MTECEYRILQISGRTLQPELMQFFFGMTGKLLVGASS